MHFTQKILIVLILTLVLFYIIAGSLSAIGHPLGYSAVANIILIPLLIVSAWIVFGPLSRLIGPPPRGNPFGDPAEDLRNAYETGTPTFFWVKMGIIALLALLGITLLVVLLVTIGRG